MMLSYVLCIQTLDHKSFMHIRDSGAENILRLVGVEQKARLI